MADQTIGRKTFDPSSCITEAQRNQALSDIIVSMGNPGPALPGDTIYDSVYVTEIAGDEWLVYNNGGVITNIVNLTTIGSGTVTAGLYIDVAGTTVDVDFTEVAGYDAAVDQYLKNDSSVFKWISDATIIATVNQTAGVNSSDGTFPFDGTTAIIGTAPASGTASNAYAQAFVDNQKVLLIKDASGTWITAPEYSNVITAKVNETGGVVPADATFDFDNEAVLIGDVPGSTNRIANNTFSEEFVDNEDIWLILRDDGQWHPVKTRRYNVLKGTASVVRGDATFTLGSPVAVQGHLPSGTVTVTNDPPLNTGGSQTVYARYDITKSASDVSVRWTSADAGNFLWMLRGLADLDTAETQVVEHITTADPHWADAGECTP